MPNAQHRSRWRRFARYGAWAGGALLLWLSLLSFLIVRFAGESTTRSADAVIVLGAAVQDGVPSPVFAARLDHAIALYQQGRARRMILTGGLGEGDTVAESEAGATYAIVRGVDAAHILTETVSRTTRQNLVEAKRLLESAKLRSCLLVSDPLHMRRACLMRDLGIDGSPAPTPLTQYRTCRSKIPFLLRELYFHHHYWLTGQ